MWFFSSVIALASKIFSSFVNESLLDLKLLCRFKTCWRHDLWYFPLKATKSGPPVWTSSSVSYKSLAANFTLSQVSRSENCRRPSFLDGNLQKMQLSRSNDLRLEGCTTGSSTAFSLLNKFAKNLATLSLSNGRLQLACQHAPLLNSCSAVILESISTVIPTD